MNARSWRRWRRLIIAAVFAGFLGVLVMRPWSVAWALALPVTAGAAAYLGNGSSSSSRSAAGR